MNVTVDDIEPTHTANTGKHHRGGDVYIFFVGLFCITFFLISITYASYICKRFRSSPLPTISFGTTTGDVDAHNHHLIRVSRGIGDDVLVTFPTFLYSEVKMSHTGDSVTDANVSSCSICLADYEPVDVVRLLPECDHFFHIKCVDAWLKAHPTCPMCRNRVFPGLPHELTD